MKLTITRAEALEYMETAIVNEPTGQRFRWAVGYRIVFLHTDGKHYEAHYRNGTGDEGERPWDYTKDVECHEVRPVQKTITVWEPIDATVAQR
jgi:hypothetical protein